MENNFKYIVYQTVNKVNNKIYIGVHKTNPNIFDGYIGNGVNINYPSTYMNPKYPFQCAVKKYGTANFIRTTLYIFDKEEDAYCKEREIVNLEFVMRKDTYNCIQGGQLQPLFYTRSKIYQFDTNGNLLKEWKDVYEVANFLETWKQSVYSAINNKTRLYNFYWSYYNEIDVKEYSNPNNSQKVYKYDSNGKCVAIYNSINEAAKENDYKPAELYNRIKECSHTRGYYYSLKLYDEFIKPSKIQIKDHIVYIYNSNGNFETQVKGSELKDYFGETKKFTTYIKTKRSLNGKYLSLEKVDKFEVHKPTNKKKVVLVYKLTGEFVGEYESIRKACLELNLDNSTVNKVLRGVSKSTKGYTLKIKDIV